jgi:hypothetical protein
VFLDEFSKAHPDSFNILQVDNGRFDAKSLKRHWILVFTAYTFLLWHQLTGGIRRRWASKPLQTFVDVLEAFRTAVQFRLVRWLSNHADVFAAHKAMLGFIWA